MSPGRLISVLSLPNCSISKGVHSNLFYCSTLFLFCKLWCLLWIQLGIPPFHDFSKELCRIDHEEYRRNWWALWYFCLVIFFWSFCLIKWSFSLPSCYKVVGLTFLGKFIFSKVSISNWQLTWSKKPWMSIIMTDIYPFPNFPCVNLLEGPIKSFQILSLALYALSWNCFWAFLACSMSGCSCESLAFLLSKTSLKHSFSRSFVQYLFD